MANYIGYGGRVEDDSFERIVKCKYCNKEYRQVVEDQVPGVRMRDDDICPYCEQSNGSSMSEEYTNYEVFNTKSCPICTNHRVLPGFNDLATKLPELAQEWDCEKNYPMMPVNVLYSSSNSFFSPLCCPLSFLNIRDYPVRYNPPYMLIDYHA